VEKISRVLSSIRYLLVKYPDQRYALCAKDLSSFHGKSVDAHSITSNRLQRWRCSLLEVFLS